MNQEYEKVIEQIEQEKNKSELFRKDREGEIKYKINYFLQNMFISAKWIREDTEGTINKPEEIKELSDFNRRELIAIAAICQELLKE
jgi:site-specific DNA-adenine methylase